MKATISFFSVLVLTALIGFSFAQEKSNAVSNETSISGCVVNGCAPARSKIYAYNSKGKLIDSANASIHSAFKLTNLQRNETHRIVCYNGTMEIGCSATITGVTCFTTLIDFCASGIIWNCY